MKPSEVIRKNDILWKNEYASKNLTEDQIFQLLIEHPKLVERPILTTKSSGVLARPLENLVEFLKKVKTF